MSSASTRTRWALSGRLVDDRLHQLVETQRLTGHRGRTGHEPGPGEQPVDQPAHALRQAQRASVHVRAVRLAPQRGLRERPERGGRGPQIVRRVREERLLPAERGERRPDRPSGQDVPDGRRQQDEHRAAARHHLDEPPVVVPLGRRVRQRDQDALGPLAVHRFRRVEGQREHPYRPAAGRVPVEGPCLPGPRRRTPGLEHHFGVHRQARRGRRVLDGQAAHGVRDVRAVTRALPGVVAGGVPRAVTGDEEHGQRRAAGVHVVRQDVRGQPPVLVGLEQTEGPAGVHVHRVVELLPPARAVAAHGEHGHRDQPDRARQGEQQTDPAAQPQHPCRRRRRTRGRGAKAAAVHRVPSGASR